jgi:hypothetical protein
MEESNWGGTYSSWIVEPQEDEEEEGEEDKEGRRRRC